MADQDVFISGLQDELKSLEGILWQNPETGASVDEGTSFLDQYTNQIFGAPFQLMDSVDKRFSGINKNIGNEYLRNFMLNSPILHIKPGLPKYTGNINQTGILQGLKNIYFDVSIGGQTLVSSLVDTLGENVLFGEDSNLKRRIYGFRETYYTYTQHTDYMCRLVGQMLNLAGSSRFPDKVFIGSEAVEISSAEWKNYRMLGTKVSSPYEQLLTMSPTANTIAKAATTASDALATAAEWITSKLATDNVDDILSTDSDDTEEAWESAVGASTALTNKISSVQFMVEPVQFEETHSNETGTSAIASAVDAIDSSVGKEIAWMSNSKINDDIISEAMDALSSGVESVVNLVGQLQTTNTGGFITNLFQGALGSLKGQKMLYPEIYKGSSSSMSYNYTVNLVSPYGDAYNYYVNIAVPLIHLICLVAPRMVNANSVSSPFLVQSYIPGMTNCQLGIIENMTITKNPDGKHVSVNGFPLTVKVNFTIKELYRNLSISPINDPQSFLFNETLNDYLCNMSGLVPSVDSYQKQRDYSFDNLSAYISGDQFLNDISSNIVEKYEDAINPFSGR